VSAEAGVAVVNGSSARNSVPIDAAIFRRFFNRYLSKKTFHRLRWQYLGFL